MSRPLSATEHFFWLFDQATLLNFAVTAQIAGEISVEQLEKALDLVQKRHPLLRVCIALDQFGKPWFKENFAKIPLRFVQRLEAENWQQEVEKEIAQPFDWGKAPLIRVVLVHSAEASELIVTIHHSIGDGLSSVYLLRDILQSVGLPDSECNILPLRSGMEEIIAEKVDNFYDLVSPENSNTESQTSTVSNSISAKTNTFSDLPHLHILTWSLSPVETTSLISRCREEKTSIHAAICTAFMLAVSEDSGKQFDLKCLSPINIRNFLAPLIEEDYGYFASIGMTTNNVTPDLTFWDIARSLKSQLHQQMTLDKIAETIAPRAAVLMTNPSPSQVAQGFLDAYNYDVFVSNLGRLNIPQQFGNIRLQAIYGPAVSACTNSQPMIGVATLGNRMFFTYIYLESKISSAKVKQIQEAAMQQLKEAQAVPTA